MRDDEEKTHTNVCKFLDALNLEVRHSIFRGCCGIEILSGFDDIYIGFFKEHPEVFQMWLKGKVYGLKGEMGNFKGREPSFVLIALSEDQSRVMEESLFICGFTEISSGFNPKSGNNISLYQKLLHKSKD